MIDYGSAARQYDVQVENRGALYHLQSVTPALNTKNALIWTLPSLTSN
jgi:hypothetical protein